MLSTESSMPLHTNAVIKYNLKSIFMEEGAAVDCIVPLPPKHMWKS